MKLEKILIIATLSAVMILLSAIRIGEYITSISSPPTPKKVDSVHTDQEQVKIEPLPEDKPELKIAFDLAPATTDPYKDPKGPFYHSVYLATSVDGVAFTKDAKVLDKASVPDVVRLKNGSLAVYAVDGAKRSRSGLMVAISKDEGQTWQQGSVQFDSIVSNAADPDVVLLLDGKVRLFFVQTQDTGVKTTTPTYVVKSAVSTDGVNFSLETGERFKYMSLGNPDVVKIGNSWFMYFTQGSKLLVASSSDGLNFKYVKDLKIVGSDSNTIKVNEQSYRQFYCDNGIKSATSTDGLIWSVEDGFRLKPESGQTVCDPTPIKTEGDNWLMYYVVTPNK